jgi:molybdate transport repressor ModE-like protein
MDWLMDWNDLRYLLAVHRHGSLARAAKELKVTKATASRRLAALEKALATRLVERKPAGLVLTAAGREAIAAAERVDAAVGSLRESLAAGSDARPAGSVRLTAPHWLASRFIIPALPELQTRYPDLDVQLVGTNQILNLAQREADVAIRNVRPKQKVLAARRTIELGGCVYASKLYLERRGRPKSPKALEGHDLLVYETLGGMPGFEWMREPGPGARIAFRANDPEALVGAATAGLGLCAVPCLIGDLEPALVRVETLGFATCDMFIVTHTETNKTPRVRAVTGFVGELFEKHRAAIEGRPRPPSRTA